MRAGLCQEWVDLNLNTDGGLDMETAENTRRWLALSRIVTTTNLCEEYLTKRVYPRFLARGQRCLDSLRKGGVGLPWIGGPVMG